MNFRITGGADLTFPIAVFTYVEGIISSDVLTVQLATNDSTLTTALTLGITNFILLKTG